jgi:hypothetical protein
MRANQVQGLKVFTTEDTEGLPKGSCIQHARTVFRDGVKCWQGLWSSSIGSYTVIVEQSKTKWNKDD